MMAWRMSKRTVAELTAFCQLGNYVAKGDDDFGIKRRSRAK